VDVSDVSDLSDPRARFEELMLPHLDAAYNLARWITRRDQDADDLTQEAYVRAWQFFQSFRGGDSRAWLLTIVRNTCYSWLQRTRRWEPTTAFDERLHGGEDERADPEMLLLHKATSDLVRRALEQMPVELREVLVLREQEGLSYKEIADVVGTPIGTVMSRLARARGRARTLLIAEIEVSR
jgi:RNA polymerase sigma-70 factor (ECF subfamily)